MNGLLLFILFVFEYIVFLVHLIFVLLILYFTLAGGIFPWSNRYGMWFEYNNNNGLFRYKVKIIILYVYELS